MVPRRQEDAFSAVPCEDVDTDCYDDDADVYVVDADGMGLETVGETERDDMTPVWSPDGTKIAFSSLRDGPPDAAEIYLMDADGSNQTRLTESPENDAFPAWQP